MTVWFLVFHGANFFAAVAHDFLAHVTWEDGPWNVEIYEHGLIVLMAWPGLIALIIIGGMILAVQVPGRLATASYWWRGILLAAAIGVVLAATSKVPGQPPWCC